MLPETTPLYLIAATLYKVQTILSVSKTFMSTWTIDQYAKCPTEGSDPLCLPQWDQMSLLYRAAKSRGSTHPTMKLKGRSYLLQYSGQPDIAIKRIIRVAAAD